MCELTFHCVSFRFFISVIFCQFVINEHPQNDFSWRGERERRDGKTLSNLTRISVPCPNALQYSPYCLSLVIPGQLRRLSSLSLSIDHNRNQSPTSLSPSAYFSLLLSHLFVSAVFFFSLVLLWEKGLRVRARSVSDQWPFSGKTEKKFKRKKFRDLALK